MEVQATHIVGGEIMYDRIVGTQDRFKLTIQIFFDCDNGNPDAIASDKVLIISQWDAVTGSYLGDFEISENSTNQETENTSYNCVKNPGSVCIKTSNYTTTRRIDPGNNGVILSWQRCCRNSKIDNITDPGSSGFTAWTKIPPKNVVNNSAKFSELPPIYVCINAPLSVNQSAIDPDGDSLVYSLFTPFLGGADDPASRRRPDNRDDYEAPPFRQVRWRTPYNQINQILGSPALNINASTGELTMTPTQIGDFALGILVSEYRDGVLVGETRRDYQISVINCQFEVLANYFVEGGTAVGGIYTFECGDSVKIINTSFIKAGLSATYFWDFGDPTSSDDTVTTYDRNTPVSYAYPGNGNYKVKLIVTSDVCSDEYQYDIRIRSSKSFELGPDKIFCGNFNQRLDTKTPDAISIIWSGKGMGKKGTPITVSDTGMYIATVSYGKCFYKDTISLLYDKIPEFSLPEDLLFCDNVDTTLQAGTIDNGLRFQWNTSPSAQNRSLTVTSPGIYSVIVANDNCLAYDTTRIWVASKPKVDDAFYCDEFVHAVDIGDIEEGQYLWSNGANTSNTSYTSGGKHWVRLTQRHCKWSDTFSILNPSVNLDLGGNKHFCDVLSARLDAGSDGATYAWNTGETTRYLDVNKPGIYSVTVIDATGCSSSDSVEYTLSTSPSLQLGHDTTICVNSPTLLLAPPNFRYEWNNGSMEQGITVIRAGTYVVKIFDDKNCFALDSVVVTVDPSALPNFLYIPNAFSPNDDGLNDLFPFEEKILQPGYQLSIYTRWGEKIFDSDQSDHTSWDGYYKGKKIHPDTYIYTVYYRGCDGNAKTQNGTLNPVY